MRITLGKTINFDKETFMISSLNHPQLKLLKTLHTKKGRTHQQQFLAEGIRVCKTLIESNAALVTLYVIPEFYKQALELCALEHVTKVTPEVIEHISFSKTASGVVGLFNIPQATKPLTLTNGIVLCEISDPGNMGTLIRTAATMNVRTAIVIGGADLWAPKVVQASAGTIASVALHPMAWHEMVQLAKKNNVELSALVVKDGIDPKTIDTSKKRLLIIGNEAHGIKQEWLTDCTEKITLAMPGKTESLNAGVAGSIALYLLFDR